MTHLYWLREDDNLRARLDALRSKPPTEINEAWAQAVALANTRMDFVRTNVLDHIVRGIFSDAPPREFGIPTVRLAMLGSCTMAHLHGAIRVAGLRRGIWIDLFENQYGQYYQELIDPLSDLHAFKPTVILLAFDAHHLTAGLAANSTAEHADEFLAERMTRIAECWRLAQDAFSCSLVQQTAVPTHPFLFGSNEHRMPGSPAAMVSRLNQQLRLMADESSVDLLAIDSQVSRYGLAAWHDSALWFRSKQEISPTAAPLYGDLVGRLIAARLGHSYKCLVLDLDNTLWGGVVGDDGLNGITIGQGTALGEAYIAFQKYARALSSRGVILAVCSKNDEVNALEPFDRHQDMVLRRGDFASFLANWNDKATNIKAIAAELNVGMDALVFVDDNPAERALVRQELPMVAVPEVTDDPITFISALSDAGYFESAAFTDDDRLRSEQYQSNRARAALMSSTTDMAAYLRGLEMKLLWRRFDDIGLQRILQLINKTNQFNLTTKRYTIEEVTSVMEGTRSLGLQLRLVDRLGDNGIIAICIGKLQGNGDLLMDTWVMSCRVLGRQVEHATLNILVAHAKLLGATRLIGEYIPTAKNTIVKDHFTSLGFTPIEASNGGSTRAMLELANFVPIDTFITVEEGMDP
jgi:FkbH-like protein